MIIYKQLITNYKRKFGKNNSGKITTRHRGGSGLKKLYRKINFNYSNYGKLSNYALWITTQYDPFRKAFIMLIKYLNGYKIGEFDYILAPEGLNSKDIIYFNLILEQKIGTSKSLKYCSIGNLICNIEFKPNQGSQLAKAAGTYALILALDKKYALIKLPSKEQRLISINCFCILGKINLGKFNSKKFLTKAGDKRHLNFRPKVRGVAMNACDHPHGGGEGRSRIGKRFLYSPWKKILFKKQKKVSKFILLRKVK
uniref:50S ribosomal protein L2 n=1 Tax=Nephromyces sp. ex Molgula occidentalis TaxID=2544991 RepID=A0A5C1H7D0_9APIC|nr:50S ribosomal protein L2 [Nephromyces sp. ex Molgula occidentalis]